MKSGTGLKCTALFVFLTCGMNCPAFADIALTTDKAEYTVGEIVHISATNNGPLTEQFLSSPFFLIFNADTNDCVFGCVGLPVVTPFDVGETVTMDWDTAFLPDPPGNYVVSLAVTNGPSVAYLLMDVVSVEPESWSGLRALYR